MKLKIGATQASQPPAPAETSKASAKPKPLIKPRKPKAPDMPPPYIDDGSHDLLQEVIAMELEQGERSPGKASSSKPRKVVDLDADEELLSLAMDEPLDRQPERHIEPDKPVIPGPAPATPSSAPKHGQSSQKVKKPSDKAAQHTPTVKGKEKEVTTGAPWQPSSPPKPRNASSSAPPASTAMNEKKCREILKNILKYPQSMIFARPVDPVLDGCPTYVIAADLFVCLFI